MGQVNFEKYEFLLEFLMDIFELNLDDLKFDTQSQIRLISIDQQRLSKELRDRWQNLLDNSYDFPSIQKEYIEKLQPWKEKFDAFNQVKSRKDFINFLEKYYSSWMRLSFEEKDISRREIFNMLRNERPRITSSIPTIYRGYKSLSIYKSDLFELTAHLKLRPYRTGTCSLLIIFSFWFENVKENWAADLNVINKDYKNTMIAYEIAKILRVLKYEQSSLIYKPSEKESIFWRSPITNINSPIHPSNNLILEILSDTPIALFEEFKSHLNKIEDFVRNYAKKEELSPYSYFESLSTELKQFLLKGKELFSRTEDLLQSPRYKKDVTIKDEIKDFEEVKITFSQIIAFFKDALEQDKNDDTIALKDKGFRTKHQIYETYQHKIDGSLPTFYKYFDALQLESYLESREKSGKGGGNEYKYKELTLKVKPILEELSEIKEVESQNNLMSERIEIQEALSYYNNHDYEMSIQIFTNVLKSAKLFSDTYLYCTCLYYLGRSHYKIGNYQEALENFKKSYSENQLLYNVKYALVETYMQLQDDENALQQVDELLSEINELFKNNNVVINPDYLFSTKFEPDEVELLHPKIAKQDMFSDFLLLLNKSSITITYFSGSKAYFTQEAFNIVNRNILSLQILYKKYLSSVFLKLEILRRQYFIEMLDGNEEKSSMILDKFIDHINYINEDLFLSYLSIEDYEIYVSFFIGLSKIIQNQQNTDKLSHEFPNTQKSRSYPKSYFYLQKFEQYYYILSHCNEILHENLEDKERIYFIEFSQDDLLKRRITDPILKTEYYLLQAYTNLNYLIDNRIKVEEDLNKNLDLNKIDNTEAVFNKYDEFHSLWPGSRHPVSFIKAAQNAYDNCKLYHLKNLAKNAESILKNTQEKYEIIEKLRLNRRKRIINRKLEVLNKDYEKIDQTIKITLQKEPKEGFKHFIDIRLKEKLENILWEKKGNLRFDIQLFNPELNKAVIEELSNITLYKESVGGRARGFFIVKLELEEITTFNSILVKMRHFRDLERESGLHRENLDKFNSLIYNAVYLNLDSFTIKVDPKDFEQYRDYFSNKFQDEYENESFKFNIIEKHDSYEFIIQIERI